MRLLRTLAAAVAASSVAALAPLGVASASDYPTWQSHGLTGVSAHGTHHIGTHDGRKVRRVHIFLSDTRRDGLAAAISVKFTARDEPDRIHDVWNPYGYDSTAEARIFSYNTGHLYIRECLGHGSVRFTATRCGGWHEIT